jgi:hypothetical protein
VSPKAAACLFLYLCSSHADITNRQMKMRPDVFHILQISAYPSCAQIDENTTKNISSTASIILQAAHMALNSSHWRTHIIRL